MPRTAKKHPSASTDQTPSDVEEKLNPQQVQFCRVYMNGWVEKLPDGTLQKMRMGNATRSYAKVYGHDIDADPAAYEVCMVNASRLLRNAKVKEFLQEIKVMNGWSDSVVDNRLIEIITTGKHTDSIAAAREYNKINSRVIERMEVEHKGFVLAVEEADVRGGTPETGVDETPDTGVEIPA